ncbi:hypothetical protein SAMN02746095_00074 [Acidocella aminolytica 101 = DSM 11237]|nr:hypothetical protein SAMN02746095_00074 [Acidocella aminolytica 101 = DSM 11237]
MGLFTGPLATEGVSAASTATAIGFASGSGEILAAERHPPPVVGSPKPTASRIFWIWRWEG